MTLSRRPGLVVPTLASLAAILALAPSGVPAALTAVGLALLLVAVMRSEPLAAHVGGLAMVLAILLAGTGTLDPVLVLVATVATVVAWDAATAAITLDGQVGPHAETARAELVHSGATLVAGAVVAGLAYLVSRLGSDPGVPTVAALVVGGAVALLYVLDGRGF